jgi:glycosyltransferase involved in cell wall biosynthesis
MPQPPNKGLRVLVFTGGNAYRPSSKYRGFLLGMYLQEFDETIEWDIVQPSSLELSALPYTSQVRQALTQGYKLFFGDYDLIFAQRPLYNKFVFLILLLNNVLRLTPLIFDLDDALFLSPHLERKIRLLSRTATACIGGSAYLCEWLRTCNKSVYFVPTLIRYSDYENIFSHRDARAIPVIGWIGSGPGYLPEVETLVPVYKELLSQGVPFKLLFAGTGKATAQYKEMFAFMPEDDVTCIPNIASETDAPLIPFFLQMDIGVMPLFASEWNRGKCAMKAIQYMASGAAVVITRIGENERLVTQNVTGVLASSSEEWVSSLKTLLTDHAARKNLGLAARAHIQQHYSFEARLPEIRTILHSVSGKTPRVSITE